jgi:hypothetical protein
MGRTARAPGTTDGTPAPSDSATGWSSPWSDRPPCDTLTKPIGPGYRRGAAFGDIALTVPGTEPQRERVQGPWHSGIVRTGAQAGALRWARTDVASEGFLRRLLHPSGGDGRPLDLTHTPDGPGSDVTALRRPWEGGTVAAAIVRTLLGAEPEAAQGGLRLRPHLSRGWPWVRATGLRIGGWVRRRARRAVRGGRRHGDRAGRERPAALGRHARRTDPTGHARWSGRVQMGAGGGAGRVP